MYGITLDEHINYNDIKYTIDTLNNKIEQKSDKYNC